MSDLSEKPDLTTPEGVRRYVTETLFEVARGAHQRFGADARFAVAFATFNPARKEALQAPQPVAAGAPSPDALRPCLRQLVADTRASGAVYATVGAVRGSGLKAQPALVVAMEHRRFGERFWCAPIDRTSGALGPFGELPADATYTVVESGTDKERSLPSFTRFLPERYMN